MCIRRVIPALSSLGVPKLAINSGNSNWSTLYLGLCMTSNPHSPHRLDCRFQKTPPYPVWKTTDSEPLRNISVTFVQKEPFRFSNQPDSFYVSVSLMNYSGEGSKANFRRSLGAENAPNMPD